MRGGGRRIERYRHSFPQDSILQQGETARDQFPGDISGVLKFAFLRALADAGRTLGVASYYSPGDDGRLDGRHLEWRNQAAWRLVDEQIHGGHAAL